MLQARQAASQQAFEATQLDAYDRPTPWLALIISIGCLPPHAAISPRELRPLSVPRRVPTRRVSRRIHRRGCIGALRIVVALFLTAAIHVPALDIFVLHDPAFDHRAWRLDGDSALPAATLHATTWRTATLAAAA